MNNLLIGKGPIKNDLLPFPFDLTSVAGLFVLMTYIRSRNEMIRFGGTGEIRNLFGSFSSSMSGNKNRPLKYYCMNCIASFPDNKHISYKMLVDVRGEGENTY